MIGTHAVVAGVDGIRTGWIVVLWCGPGTTPAVHRLASLNDAAAVLPQATAVVAVDIPIGLPVVAQRGGRDCDQAARSYVGPRKASVFSPPALAALAARTHTEACALNRASGPDAPGLSIQAFAILPKIAEAKVALAQCDWLRRRMIEVHPEVCFRTLAKQALAHGKLCRAGRDERCTLLVPAALAPDAALFAAARQLGAKPDDLIDACVAAWTAWRCLTAQALVLPEGAVSGPRIWH